MKHRWGAGRNLSFLFYIRLSLKKSFRAWYDGDADGIYLKKHCKKTVFHAQNKIIIFERSGSTAIVLISMVSCLMSQVVQRDGAKFWLISEGSNRGPISVQSFWMKTIKLTITSKTTLLSFLSCWGLRFTFNFQFNLRAVSLQYISLFFLHFTYYAYYGPSYDDFGEKSALSFNA